MLKQYTWIFEVASILLVAYFGAKIINVYLGGALEVRRSIGVVSPVEAVTSLVPTKGDYGVISERNIFSSAGEAETPEGAVAPGEEGYAPEGEAMKTSLSIKVLGILMIGEGCDKRSSATVDPGGGAGVDVFAVGQEPSFTAGVKITCVKPDRIEFVHAGRLEYAELAEGLGENIFGPPRLEEKLAARTPTPEETVAKMGEGRYVIDSREIENTIQNLDKLYTEIRAVPNFQDGRVSGMKILSIKPGSIFAKLGLKRGDILQRINGVELDVRRGFEIFSQLKDQKSLTLDLIRGGANQTVEYEIR